MTTTTIHVMRHGEVDNPSGVLYGRLPGFHLTALGRQMAQMVAEALVEGDHDLTHIVASPLERAQETAAPTAELYGLPVATDDRLIEAGNRFEGEVVNGNRAVLAHPRNWARYRNPLRPSWGEAYVDQALRMRDAVRSALAHAMGHEALVVSHQLPIWCLRLFIEGRAFAHLPAQRECALASLTSLTFSGHTLVGLTYWEPAAELISQAEDLVPGTSTAATKVGEGAQ